MKTSCPRCHLKLDRGEHDYFIGPLLINFVVAELIVVVGGFLVVLLTWPTVPWQTLKWGLIALMVPMPIVFYPFAKTLWLAIDLTFRPITWNDIAGHGENLPRDGTAER